MENLLVLGHFWFKFWGDETYLVPPGQNLGGRVPPVPPAIYAHVQAQCWLLSAVM